MPRRGTKVRVTNHRCIAMLLVSYVDRSQVWARLTVRLGPIYWADLHSYLICEQLAAMVSPRVNLFILTPGKGLLKAQADFVVI